MKYCRTCGSEMSDEAVVCVKCGCAAANNGAVGGGKSSNAPVILGIVGIIFAWIFALVGHITSIIGIVLGIKEYKATKKAAGLILSIIGEVCSILSSLIGVILSMSMYY